MIRVLFACFYFLINTCLCFESSSDMFKIWDCLCWCLDLITITIFWCWLNRTLFLGLSKTKAQKGSPSGSSTTTMKRPQHPDVVTNAISQASVSKEVTRLEALCEGRTKELNKIKIELRKRNRGFEAMAVLIKYFTEEVKF